MRATERAAKVTGAVQAIRLRERLESQLIEVSAQFPPDREAEEDLAEAIGMLNDNFPGIAEETDAEQYAMARGHGSKKNKARAERGPDAAAAQKAAAGAGKASRSAAKSAGGSTRSPSPRKDAGTRPRAASRARGRGRSRAFEQTGLPGAGRSVSQSLLQLIGLTIGVSILYLLLWNGQRSGRGRSVLEIIAGSTSKAVRGLIAPRDPLAGAKAKKAKPGDPGYALGPMPAGPRGPLQSAGPGAPAGPQGPLKSFEPRHGGRKRRQSPRSQRRYA